MNKYILDLKRNYKKLLLTIFICCVTFLILKHIAINLTPSAPLGIYLTYNGKKLKKGDYIIYKMNPNYEKYIDENMRDLMTIKQIAATCGDKIRIIGDDIYINKTYMGKMIEGIPTVLSNEMVLKNDEVFTMSKNSNSLDGRYYGAIKVKDIKSKAILLKKLK